MIFEWDEVKSESNYTKHRIRFEEAQTVFLDPRSLEFYDDEHSEDEDRFIRIGLSETLKVLIVIYRELTNENIRIISSRKATTEERKIYEEGI